MFELSASGGTWTASILYNFQPEERMPGFGLTLTGDGVLYGTAGYPVFRLVPPKEAGVLIHC